MIGFFVLASPIAMFFGASERALDWLAKAPYSADCDYIVLLPSGGIPSPTMLMRAYKAAEESHINPRAKIIISHKTEPPLKNSTIWTIRNELIQRGVPSKSIILETRAQSTSDHAKYIKEARIGDPANDKYLLVTSPVHIRRSVMAFEAAGFRYIFAAPATSYITKEDRGGGQYFRYDFWSSLTLSVEALREFTAIAYYKILGLA